ncbi:MAG: hypothetical protein J6T10_20580 [Methanobrevibacter sp.]|nr:hypothetical protein [Methanobrevibacter sp.]
MEEKQRNVLLLKKSLWQDLRLIKAVQGLKSYESVLEYLIQNCKNENLFQRIEKNENERLY